MKMEKVSTGVVLSLNSSEAEELLNELDGLCVSEAIEPVASELKDKLENFMNE